MSNSEIIDRVGISIISYSDAVKNAIKEIQKNKTVHWFQIIEHRGRINPNGEIEYQVIIRFGV